MPTDARQSVNQSCPKREAGEIGRINPNPTICSRLPLKAGFYLGSSSSSARNERQTGRQDSLFDLGKNLISVLDSKSAEEEEEGRRAKVCSPRGEVVVMSEI